MMHEIAFRIVNVTKSSRFGLPRFDHRQDRPWLLERASSSGSAPMARIPGTALLALPLSSHLGTDLWLQGQRWM